MNGTNTMQPAGRPGRLGSRLYTGARADRREPGASVGSDPGGGAARIMKVVGYSQPIL